MNESKKNSPRYWMMWLLNGAVGNINGPKVWSALATLRKYLDDTTDSGHESASLIGIYEFAPDVFCVLDQYMGQIEFDAYFNVKNASFADAEEKSRQPTRKVLKNTGLDCYNAGSCSAGVGGVFPHIKKILKLTDSLNWFPEPKQINLR